MHLSISIDIVSTKIYDKRDDFDFEILNFSFLDGDVPHSTSYGVFISQLIHFARASSYVTDFNTRNKLLTQNLLKQGYGYHKLHKTFSKFYSRYYDLIFKFQVGLKSLLHQGLLEPEFYGDLVYKLKKIVGSNNFSAQFIKIISHYTVELRLLELVGTVGATSTHPCIRVILSLTIFKLVHVYFMSSRTSRFLSIKCAKRM